MSSLAVVALSLLGLGIVVLLFVVSRGPREPRIGHPVPGTLQLTGASGRPLENTGRVGCQIHGVVTVPGHPPTPIERRISAKVSRWPLPGQTLAVVAEAEDPTTFRIDWAATPDAATAARQQAAQLATQMGAVHDAPSSDEVPWGSVPLAGVDVGAILADLLGGGRTGTGEVLSFLEQPGDVVVTQFDLMVHLDDASPPFPATLTANFAPNSRRRTEFARVGARIPVRFDPAHPETVTIDIARL